jgi:Exocyst complex component Sec6
VVCLAFVYRADHSETKTSEGRIFTSLCEDIFSVAGIQLRTIKERLTKKSEALVQAVGVILKNLYDAQVKERDKFLKDFESCCAASNDFLRMGEKCDALVSEIRNETKLSPVIMESLEEQSAALIGLYSADAVHAGQTTHAYIFEPIQEAIAADLFGSDWLNDLTHNQLAWTLVRTLEDFMEDLEAFLDGFMVQKVVEALVSASVIFYIRTFLGKASLHKSNKESYFSDNKKALDRMAGDISTIKDYFDNLAKTMNSLKRVIDREFEVLETFQEMIAIAAGLSASDPHDFILVLQKRIRNIEITRLVVGDVYHLVQPTEERSVYELVDSMEEEMMVIAPTDERAVASAQQRSTVPGLRLDQMMAKHCDSSQRKRPFKSTALERTENMLQGWRETWAEGTTTLRASTMGSTTRKGPSTSTDGGPPAGSIDV